LNGTSANFNSIVISKTVGDYRQATLGATTGAGLYVTNVNSGGYYGLLVGSSYSYGDVWLQASRTDGNTSSYNISLNASGGTVTIGTVTAESGYKLTVAGAGYFGSVVAATGFTGGTFPYNSVLGSGADATTSTVYSGSTSGYTSSIDVAGGGATNPNTIIFKTASVERVRIAATGATTFSVSAAAPIFYDSDDSSYYLNPNNTSFSALLSGTIRLEAGGFGTNSRSSSSAATLSRTFAPQGAANGYNAGAITAAIKIRLPFRANDCMWSMKVRIYNYTNDATSEYTLGNYSYAAGAYHRGAYFIGGTGAPPQTVRFGNDGSYDCVWIGETSTVWSYPQVSVIDFAGGYVRSSVQETANNWDITFVTSFATVADSITPQVRFSNVFAPTYYDINNTAFYLIPSTTSNLNVLQYTTAYVSDSIRNNASVADDDTFGIYWDSGRSAAYGIYKQAGAWSPPYPDLCIMFYTGISLGADASYGGINFYADYTRTTLVLSVNNSSYNTGGIYVHGTAYASAYYETSDARLKTILEDNSRVKGIELIKPKLYKKDGKTEFGYIAQDFMGIMPYALNNDNVDKMYSLVYREVHTAKIASLEDSVESLKEEILYLKNKLKETK
jgi:hypothetical protein